MKLNSIFAGQLYSFILENNKKCEYQKKLDDWEDFNHIYQKAKEFNIKNIDNFYDEIFFDRELLIEAIKYNARNKSLNLLFKNLHNKSLVLEKFEESKLKLHEKNPNRDFTLSRLRLYALRVENDCFFITGGLIKSKPDLSCKDGQIETQKLKKLREFLIYEEKNQSAIFDNILEF